MCCHSDTCFLFFSYQIETNRNTALTLACFQGRHEVVNLLVERQANVEHRAKVSKSCTVHTCMLHVCVCIALMRCMHMCTVHVHVCCIYHKGFFLEKIFREGEAKFSRNEGGQAKIHEIYGLPLC